VTAKRQAASTWSIRLALAVTGICQRGHHDLPEGCQPGHGTRLGPIYGARLIRLIVFQVGVADLAGMEVRQAVGRVHRRERGCLAECRLHGPTCRADRAARALMFLTATAIHRRSPAPQQARRVARPDPGHSTTRAVLFRASRGRNVTALRGRVPPTSCQRMIKRPNRRSGDQALTRDYLVAGVGFEPTTSGL